MEWNVTNDCAEVVASGDREHDFIVCVVYKKGEELKGRKDCEYVRRKIMTRRGQEGRSRLAGPSTSAYTCHCS